MKRAEIARPVRPPRKRNRKGIPSSLRPRIDKTTMYDTITLGEFKKLRESDEK